MNRLLITILLLLPCFSLGAEPVAMMQLAEDTRGWFVNPDGSCVQCSIGMAGIHCNDPNAASLLWDTVYGPREHGGSGPSRVSNYCNRRGIKAWNVTGANTIDWCRWAAKTGRFAAIGAASNHFQTLYGHDPSTDTFYVCNNNSTYKIDSYSLEAFKRLHYASGQWIVVLKKSSSEPPVLTPWWE